MNDHKAIAKERSDWLLDAVACATQDRRFLRGEEEYDEVAGNAILLNAEKAIQVAIDRAAAANDGKAQRLEGSAEAPLGRSEHIPTPEGRGGEASCPWCGAATQIEPWASLHVAKCTCGISVTINVPGGLAEAEAAYKRLLSSPRVEEVRREALEEAAEVADEAQASAREDVASDKEEMGEDYDPYSFGAGFLSGEITASINIATAIRSLSPPVG